MQFPQKTTGRKKKIAIIIASLVIFIAAALLVYFFLQQSHNSSKSNSNDNSSTRSTNSVDYSGPSSEDVANSQNGKKNSASNSSTGTNTSQTSAVEVGITYADTVGSNFEIRAFTPSVIEGDGTCTATLTKDGQTVQASSLAFIDATSSQCRPIDIDLSKFPSKGTWTLTVEYSSKAHKGVSDPMKVTI